MQLKGSMHDGNPLNYRSLLILITYLSVCLAITTYICVLLVGRAQFAKKSKWPIEWGKVVFFGLLAIASLSATWYYMFDFFAYSYHDWACGKNLELEEATLDTLEMWLRETKLFKEAWGSVVNTPHRYWWSGQIFFWTTAWSLFIGVMGRRYQIPNTWAYMLLGQIVAISFAQNLFFLSIVLSRPYFDLQSTMQTPNVYLELLPLLVSLVSSAIVPYVADSKHFLYTLLIPHLLLFIPTTIQAHGKLKGPLISQSVTKRYIRIFSWIFGAASLFQVWTMFYALASPSPVPLRRARDTCAFEPAQDTQAAEDVGQRLLGTVFEHPAVSSVSWDVVFCTVGFLSWAAAHRFYAKDMLGGIVAGSKEKKREE
ncbi:hypothetical protein ASPWEDRAFT_31443 [Aspergillus wentii DTO 134E9]|uniref:Uncharacterized protein n=1 Tax=Aspergillus wentii DTO 134E9 TaxID=1073089 RepID=A0A1L9RCB6_ASPWE|nr:uncharacterized protein ASPWEDRAFT_31443 [Aspergillus wentii DTO 134E9]KAI9935111.1 hypothetical protein MW887_000732 [Aspergillus wentii]OJJ32552.1 hypothetical protein ASPWEDRAFT_31443 [Aspergillus wentii DTO 134E9]